MRRSLLTVWLSVFGMALWLASRVVSTEPAFALAVGPAALIFFALAARPPRH